ncbi:hypothetical protein L596_008270 [Steinernema carpocapsae]|uniref:G-protein coupled receptors family 1 profile domain-containing protein n=1 Tax=Steinernema carpocapsae TaxID=34508 RepID=A0A4U5PC85_STECR|nr:hypothetical protein L596_008270 [Steinernema carpocapsae]
MLETNRPIASIPRDPLTTTLYAVEIVICLFAVVEHLIFIKISYKSALVHPNLRILLVNQSVAFLLITTMRLLIDVSLQVQIRIFGLGQQVSVLIIHFGNNCVWNYTLCKAFTTVYDAAIFASVLAFLNLTIERAIASFRVSSYEKTRQKFPFVLISIAVSWAICVTVNVVDSVNSIHAEIHNSHQITCAQTLLSPKFLFFTRVLTSVLNLIVLLVYTAIYVINNRRLAKITTASGSHSLSRRFQILDNIRSMRLLFPSIGLILLENLMSLFITLIIWTNMDRKNYSFDVLEMWNYEQWYTLSGVSLAALEPLVLVFSHVSFRGAFQRAFCPKKVIEAEQQKTFDPEIKRTEEQTVYFRNLQRAWM